MNAETSFFARSSNMSGDRNALLTAACINWAKIRIGLTPTKVDESGAAVEAVKELFLEKTSDPGCCPLSAQKM